MATNMTTLNFIITADFYRPEMFYSENFILLET